MPTFVKSYARGSVVVHAYSRNVHKSLLVKQHQLTNSLSNARVMMRTARTQHSMVKAMNEVQDYGNSLRNVSSKILDKKAMGYKLLKRGR